MDHIGIDVHKRESQIYILAEGGEVIEQRIRTSYCQVLWIEGDQAAPFFRSSCRSTRIPSTKRTPARTSGISSALSSRRQWACAASSSLNAIVKPAVREPAPFVTRSRNRTVANVDSIGFVVRRCFQWSAG